MKTLQVRIEEFEKKTIKREISICGNYSTVAKRLGISRSQLYRKLEKYGLETATEKRNKKLLNIVKFYECRDSQ